jgi:hypothetical protein
VWPFQNGVWDVYRRDIDGCSEFVALKRNKKLIKRRGKETTASIQGLLQAEKRRKFMRVCGHGLRNIDTC